MAGARKMDGWFSGFSKYVGERDCGLLVSQWGRGSFTATTADDRNGSLDFYFVT